MQEGFKKKHRSKNPATVKASLIHQWVMKRKTNRLGAENEAGLKKLRAVRIDLSGDKGTRSVQMTFIEIRKLRKEYKLRIKAEEIIINLIYELKPMATRQVIKNIMKKDNKDSFKARTSLDKFHDLVMQFVETFQEAREFGAIRRSRA